MTNGISYRPSVTECTYSHGSCRT